LLRRTKLNMIIGLGRSIIIYLNEENWQTYDSSKLQPFMFNNV